MEIELERTFLLKDKPKDLEKYESIEILDIYIPKSADHPILRIRKIDNNYTITKKAPVEGTDSSKQYEKTIPLSREEFEEIAPLEGKRLRKIRYYYPWPDEKAKGERAEIDVYLDDLEGLITVDFEFNLIKEKNNFTMPAFCLADITQEKFFAGGWLAGRKYSDIKSYLDKHGYRKK